ncbi:MAG: HD domain-containing protein, partial [bacterium]
VSDIEKKLIRLTRSGNFEDDPVRLLRAIRLAVELDFEIEQETWNELCKLSHLIKNEAPERIRDEFVKLIMLQNSPRGFHLMRESKLLHEILPELDSAYGISQSGLHEHDVFEHIILTVKYAPTELRSKLTALLHDIGKPAKRVVLDDGRVAFYGHDIESTKIAKRFLKWLRFPNDVIEDVITVIRYHMFSYGFSDKGLRRFIRRVGPERMPILIKLRFADSMAQHEGKTLRDEQEFEKRVYAELTRKPPLTVRDLDINGYDIMDKFSLKPGPIIGRILKYLLSFVLDNPEMNKKQILIEKAKEYIEKVDSKERVEGSKR